ncbi:MAG: FAD-dependent monooxygenase [Alkalispirochaeta sp.]
MHDVVVVGAGPVGMTVAALCATDGLDTVVVERRRGGRDGSRAIGVMPASLEILDRIGVADAMVERGVTVMRAFVHGRRRLLGQLEFSGISGRHPYVLVVPQVETEAILRERLNTLGVPVFEGTEFTGSIENTVDGLRLSLAADASSVEDDRFVKVHRGGARVSDGIINSVLDTSFVSCADGFHGRCGDDLGVTGLPRFMPYRFIMGDTVDKSDLGSDAHLWFTPTGAIESFPLTGGRRRWIAQLPGRLYRIVGEPHRIPETLQALVGERTGYPLENEEFTWTSSFRPVTRIAGAAGAGRIFLAGDALHTMSPIGGQGMNSGLADAELLAELLRRLRRTGEDRSSLEEAHQIYGTARLRSGESAAQRAAVGTHIGSLRGGIPSALRSAILGMTLASPVTGFLASHFTMRTIPYRRSMHALR